MNVVVCNQSRQYAQNVINHEYKNEDYMVAATCDIVNTHVIRQCGEITVI